MVEHTSRSILDIHIKPIDLHLLAIWPVKRSRLSSIHPLRSLRSKRTPEKVDKVFSPLLPGELVSIRLTPKRQDDFLAILRLANRNIVIDAGTGRLELIVGRIRSGTLVGCTAAFITEVSAGIAVALGREDVDEADRNEVHLRLLAVVEEI